MESYTELPNCDVKKLYLVACSATGRNDKNKSLVVSSVKFSHFANALGLVIYTYKQIKLRNLENSVYGAIVFSKINLKCKSNIIKSEQHNLLKP